MGEEGSEEVTLRFLGYEDVETRPKSDLRALTTSQPVDPGAAVVGYQCQVGQLAACCGFSMPHGSVSCALLHDRSTAAWDSNRSHVVLLMVTGQLDR